MSEERLLLAADIGATKSWFALAAPGNGVRWRLVRRYEDRDFVSFAEALEAFLAEARAALGTVRISGACLAAAGPVSPGRVRLTNRDWVIDAETLGARFGIDPIAIVNDFFAAAHGTDALAPEARVTLQAGEPLAHAPRVVIGAGTGLGVAYAVRCGNGFEVVAGEAGHMGFSPLTDLQAELWRHLHARHGRVTAEHVLSGSGLVAIHRFLAAADAGPFRPANDAAAVQRAAEAGDATAQRALDLFAEIYGAVAGDHALAVLARGGVYLAGGIAPRILSRLQSGRLIDAFNDKREHAALARLMPVYVVMEDRLALLGATALVLDMCQ